MPKDKEGRIEKVAFTYDAQKDVYRCPMGVSLAVLRTSQDQQKSGVVIRRQYGGCAECARCVKLCVLIPRTNTQGCWCCRCCKDPKKGRTVNRGQYEEHRERLRVRMDTDIGRARYKLRRSAFGGVEPPLRGSGHGFGLMKHNWGIRRFLRRGLESVHTEWVLTLRGSGQVCTAVNLGILLKHWEVVKAMG